MKKNMQKKDDILTEKILSLLALTNLTGSEKELWLRLLPEMTQEEKLELSANLEGELDYEFQSGVQAGQRFLAALEKGI